MKKIAVLAATALLAGACGAGPEPEVEYEGEYNAKREAACYTKDARFKKYDDDCHDDGLYRLWEVRTPSPARTSGGMQTAGPVRRTPGPKRTR